METDIFIEKVKGMIQIIDAKDFPKIKGRAHFLKQGSFALGFVESHRIEAGINKLIYKELKTAFTKLIEKGRKND